MGSVLRPINVTSWLGSDRPTPGLDDDSFFRAPVCVPEPSFFPPAVGVHETGNATRRLHRPHFSVREMTAIPSTPALCFGVPVSENVRELAPYLATT